MFNDDFFEGVVLKIKEGFLITNPEVEEALKIFKEVLENAKYSIADPQHQRNLYELENYKEKRKNRIEKDKQFEVIKKKEEEKYQKYIDLEIIPLETSKREVRTFENYDSDIVIGDEIFTVDEYLTKSGIRKPISNKIKTFIKDKETFLKFCRDNYLPFSVTDLHPNFDYKDIIVGVNKYGIPTLSISNIYAKIYSRNKKDNSIEYRLISLIYNWDKHCFETGLNYTDFPKYLDGYENDGNFLRKK